MKIPLSWLKEYLPLSLAPEEIGKALTLLGLEVDKIEPLPLSFTGVVIATVVDTIQHPNADRLRIATVFDGTDKFQVVCGAPNCVVGLRTAFAPIGALLKDEAGKEFKIKKSKLREIESFGMLCSAKELGLGQEGDGILDLDPTLKEGTPLAAIYGDTLFEISLTPNLGHCLSVLGVARELAAKLELPLSYPLSPLQKNASLSVGDFIQINIEDKIRCSRYCCRIVEGVKVGPSPDWLQRRLDAAGIRSVNNVVDISNYVMLSLGHPIHMFDYNTLRGKTLSVTTNTSFPTLTTLDGVLRHIPQDTLLIADGEAPVAFAGVMGGEDSSITDTTHTILIEAAHFSPTAIRYSAKKLGLHTDASHRFERGTDPLVLERALDYAAFLLQEYAQGEVASGMVTVGTPPERKTVSCRTARVNQILGTTLSTGEVRFLLEKLHIPILKEETGSLVAHIPSYRNDLQEEIDLIEEVARMYGYDNIPLSPPLYTTSTLPDSPIYLIERKARSLLIESGLTELHTCDLISPFLSELTRGNTFSEESIVSVLHPSSVEQSILRVSLLPGLLQAAKYNFDRQRFDISGFEVGKIHFKNGEHYSEPSMAGILITGNTTPHHWDPKPRPVDFFDLKGKVENFLTGFGLPTPTFEVSHLTPFHPGRQARVKMGDLYLGALGEVHPAHLEKIGIKQRVYYAEFNLFDLLPFQAQQTSVEPLSLYPGSERDWTIPLNEETPIGAVLNALYATPSKLLEKAYLLDLYKSAQIGKDKKNATFRLSYRDKEKTVAQETVDREHSRVIQEVAKKLGYTI